MRKIESDITIKKKWMKKSFEMTKSFLPVAGFHGHVRCSNFLFF